MDSHFGKQLVERERIHHADHYHNYRHVKGPKGAWGDDEVGGRESMRVRYNHGYDRKSFNENLNPLKSFLCHRVGKNWDKIHAEIKKAVDTRSVIGAHIFEHLYDYVIVKTRVGEKGQIEGLKSAYWGWKPIKECYADYYVCPKSGMLRIVNRISRKAAAKQRELERERQKLQQHRVVDERNHLYNVDGVWFHVKMERVPDGDFFYDAPLGCDRDEPKFKCGNYNKPVYKCWNELNEAERQLHGVFKPRVWVRDVMEDCRVAAHKGNRVTSTGGSWHRDWRSQAGLYAASKQTAGHKILKQAGLAQ